MSVIIALAVLFSFPTSPAQAQQQKITLASPIGGVVGGYLVHLPDDYAANPTKKYPLMLFLHGLSETGSGSQVDLDKVTTNGPPRQIKDGTFPQSFTVNSETFKYIVISPQFNRRLPVITVAEYQAFLDYILPLYQVDLDRVYMTGISIGGGLIWNYCGASTQNSSKVAAAVLMAGSSKPNLERSFNMASQNLPIWALHNTGDPSVPVSYTIDYVDTINMYTPAPVPLAKKSLFNSNSHGVWYTGYSLTYREDGANVYEWMLRYKRNLATAPPVYNLPVAVAGNDQVITQPAASTTVNGNGSFGTPAAINAYKWSQINGPSTVVFSNSTAAQTSVTGLTTTGIYTLKLLVTDINGNTSADFMTITVQPGNNLLPIAVAGNNSTITLPTSTVTLNGSGSSDPDGTIVSYAWTQLDGPRTAVLGTPNNSSTTASVMTFSGTYIFQLRVTDNLGGSSVDNVEVTVLPDPNLPPNALAGADINIVQPTSSATLNASASNDPDGTITKFEWKLVDGPGTASISNPTAASTLVSGLTILGNYVFQVTVTDNNNAVDSDQVYVLVQQTANQLPVSIPGNSQTIVQPASSVTLNGSASFDNDGTIDAYLWSQISGPVTATIANPSFAQTAVSGLTQAGTYTFRLRVTDNNNASVNASVNIIVQLAPNLPPVAQAGPDQVITQPVAAGSLNGTLSTDPDGTLTSFTWSQVSGPVTAVISTPSASSSVVLGLSTPGTYGFKLIVKDNNNVTNEDITNITVYSSSGTNIPPVANAGPDQSINLPVNTVTLNASTSSDADGAIVAYAWSQTSGPVSAAILKSGEKIASVKFLTKPGVYNFSVKVTDNRGGVASDAVSITVTSPNQAPTANAGPDTIITLPINKTRLLGTASYDTDGKILTYKWTQLSGPKITLLDSTRNIARAENFVSTGNYSFQLTVTDNKGSTDIDVVAVTIRPVQNMAPVANAGADLTITRPVSGSALSGSGSNDPDGTIVSYEWKQISGPLTATIQSPTSSATAINGLLNSGTFGFQLKVTDNFGTSSVDIVNIIVKQPAVGNKAPVARAGTDQNITLPANSATVAGNTSSDIDGTISTYNWRQVSGPAIVNIALPNAATTGIGPFINTGIYTFELLVTDNLGFTANDLINITIKTGTNVIPVANAGNDLSIQLPISIASLSGSGTDNDGLIASYAWTQTAGPITASIVNAGSAATAVQQLLVPGIYTYQLTVTDDRGGRGTDKVNVTVAAPVNMSPIANAGTDTTIFQPLTKTFLYGAGSYDADGKITAYKWRQVSGQAVTMFDTTRAIARIDNLITPGAYTFELSVTDNAGAVTKDMVVITLKNPALSAPGGQHSGNLMTDIVPVNTAAISTKVWPNPTTGILNIVIRNQKSGKGTLRLFDLHGRLVIEERIEKNTGDLYKSIRLPALLNGQYFLEISGFEQKREFIKVIKQ